MRRVLLIGLSVILLLGVAGWGVLKSQAFWHWGGWELVNLARDRLNGELQVAAVQGHALTGFTFTEVTLTGPQGEILHTPKVEMRFSLWSLLRLQPVIGSLIIHQPRLTLRQDRAGGWELASILKKRPPPPFRSLEFPAILLEHGQVVVIRSGVSQRFEDLDLSLGLTVLHPKRPEQELRVRRLDLAAATPLGRFALRGGFTYAHDQLVIDSMEVMRGGQSLASLREGVLGPRHEGLFSFDLGPGSGALLQLLRPGWPQDWEIQGNFRLALLGLTRYQLTGVGQVRQASFDLKANLSLEAGEWSYDLDAKLGGLGAEMLSPFSRQWAEKLKDLSPIAAGLALKGRGPSWPPARLEGTLDLSAFRGHGISVEQLQISLAGNPREQNLKGLVRGNFGKLTLAADGPLLSDLKGNLQIEAENWQPARLGLERAGETALNGKFRGAFHWTQGRALAGLNLAGDLEARGRLGSEPLEDLRVRLIWQQPRLEIPQASFRLGPLAAQLSGSQEGDRLACQFKGNLAPGATRPYLPVTVGGPLELAGALSGTLQDPHFSLQGRGSSLALGEFSLKTFSFKASGAGWPIATGDLELRGADLSTPAAVFSQANFSARGEANLWRFNFTAGVPGAAQAEVLGAADLRTRPVSLVLQRLWFSSPEYTIANTGPVQLRLFPGLQLAAAAFKINDGELTARLEAQGTRLTGLLNLRHFPARLLSMKGPPLQGKIDGQVSIGGEPGTPLIQGKVNWGPGQVGEFAFQSLQTTFDYRAGLLNLNGGLEEKTEGARLVWSGQIPLRLSLSPQRCSWGEQNLSLTVKGEKTDLAMLTAVSHQVQAAEGELNIMAQVQGNPRHPQVSGQVRWGEGSIKLRLAGLPYRLLPGAAQLQGSKITIPEVLLQSGGTLRLSGNLTLQGFTPGHLEMRAQLLNFLALRREGSQAEANGALTLSGPFNNARLTGQILVPKATFATSFFQSGPNPDIHLVQASPPEPAAPATGTLAFWRNMQVDFTLQSAGEVWVKNKDIQVDLAGSLRVSKAPGQERLVVGGVMRAEKGSIDIQGHAFKVAEGTVTLSGKPGVPGILAGRAISEMDEVTLMLDVSGPANKPALRFSSNPALPPADVLSYLVYGRPAAALSREEYNTVGQQALGAFGGVTTQKLKEILGEDFPLVCDLSMRCGEQTVGVSKPLTQQLSVTFEHKTNPLYRDNTEQMRLEYKVNKYLSADSTMGLRNTGGDVLFNYDF
jgi:translocation and assembly module TamB